MVDYTPAPDYERVFTLSMLASYPASPFLDMVFWLPPGESMKVQLHAWMLTPSQNRVTLAVDDDSYDELERTSGPAGSSWLSFGECAMKTGFSQLRVTGLTAAEAQESWLVVASDPSLRFDGEDIREAERKLRGISREEAGFTSLSPSRLRTGESGEFRYTYTAGAAGLPKRAILRMLMSIKMFDDPQTTDPEGLGYVEAVSGGEHIEILNTSGRPGVRERTDLYCRVTNGMPPFATFTLRYVTNKAYIYADRFVRNDRMYWFTKTPLFSTSVSINGETGFCPLADANAHSVEYVPGPAERLFLFLPGCRRRPGHVTLTGLFTDHYRNVDPSGPLACDFELFLVREAGEARIGTPERHFTDTYRFEMRVDVEEPGVYRVEARRGGEMIARSNPLRVIEADGGNEIYWGDIHAHSEMSDGSGDFYELFRHAKEDGRLDFAASADHACYFSDNQWEVIQDTMNHWNSPGEFVTLPGYEWAGKQIHRNVYTSRDRLKLFRGMYPPTSNLNTLWDHFRGDEECVAGPHGVLSHGVHWDQFDQSCERFVEIYSMWGANDTRENPLIPDFALKNPRGKSANELLLTGSKLGFTGGGDCHEGHAGFSCEDPDGQGVTGHTFSSRLRYRCGFTAAVMPELNRRELVRALRERSTYATTGARILIDWEVSGTPMGGLGANANAECRFEVNAEDTIRSIEIVRDGEVVFQTSPGALDTRGEWTNAVPAGEHYYYLHVVQEDDQQAWASPVWITSPG